MSQSKLKLILVTFAARAAGCVGVGVLTGVVPVDDEGENVLRSIRSGGNGSLLGKVRVYDAFAAC